MAPQHTTYHAYVNMIRRIERTRRYDGRYWHLCKNGRVLRVLPAIMKSD